MSRWPIRIESGSSVPLESVEPRLVVEQVHLRRRARLEQVDHPLGPGREVGEALDARRRLRAGSGGRRRAIAVEQRRQGHRAEAQAGPVRPKKCRRVRCWPSSASGSTCGHSLVIVSSRLRISCAIAV